jgi:hypothetical protein
MEVDMTGTQTQLSGHRNLGGRTRSRLTILAFAVTTGLTLTLGAFATSAHAAGTSVGAGTWTAHRTINPDSSSWS